MNIKTITNEQALRFLRENKAHKEVVFIRSCDHWWGAFESDELAGVTGTSKGKNHIKLASTFVAPEHRRKGVATALLRCILEYAQGNKIISYSRPDMARINAKHGFKTIHTLKNGTQKQEYYNEQ